MSSTVQLCFDVSVKHCKTVTPNVATFLYIPNVIGYRK